LLGGGSPAATARGPNPASARAEDANKGPGVDPVFGAELLRWSRAVGMLWIDWPTVQPELGAAERIVATAQGFMAGASVG
jgi:hypothetical protein